MIATTVTDTSITLYYKGRLHAVTACSPSFSMVKEAMAAEDYDFAVALINPKTAIEHFSDGEFVVSEDTVTYNGCELPDAIQKRIIGFYKEGAPFKHLLAFWKNVSANPSRRSTEELFSFLEHQNIPIGTDGCFYAYKSVRAGTLMDWHSNTCYNGVGETLSMPRNYVDDDANRGCSYGYHVGSIKYASSFGGSAGTRTLLIVKVNPAHVVSVPHDCQHQKVRTSEYTVVQEYDGPLPDVYWDPSNGYDDGVFEEDPEADLRAQIEEVKARYKDELEGLETAINALLDCMGSSAPTAGLEENLEKVTNLREAELRPLREELNELLCETELAEY